MIKDIDHLAITVSEIENSKSFYVGIFGFEEVLRLRSKIPGINQISFLKKGGGVLELLEVSESKEYHDDPAMPGFKHLCFEVADFDAEFERIKGMGIKVLEEPHILNEEQLTATITRMNVDMKKGLKRAVFADPDGLPIEILEWL